MRHILDGLDLWSRTFGILIDPGKTEVLHLFTTTTSRIPPIPGVKVVKTMKWLGVTFDSWLSFHPHITERIAVASKRFAPLLVIKSNLRGLSPAAALRVYEGAIRLVITYASPAWWSTLNSQTTWLQSFERTCLLRVAGLYRTMCACLPNALLGVRSMENQLTFDSLMAACRLPFLPPGHPLRTYMAHALLPLPPHQKVTSGLQHLLDYVPPVYHGWSLVMYPPWQPQRRSHTKLVDFGSPPSEASTFDVLQYLHYASRDHVVLDLKISHSKDNPKFIVSECCVRIDFREPNLKVRVFDLPDHTVGQRIWACLLVFVDFLAHELPPEWRGRKLLFVLTDKSLVNAFHFPLIPTQQFSMLHNAAAKALMHLKRTIHLLPVDKELFYLLPSPPPPIRHPPRERILVHTWVADLDFGISKRVMRLEVRRRSAAGISPSAVTCLTTTSGTSSTSSPKPSSPWVYCCPPSTQPCPPRSTPPSPASRQAMFTMVPIYSASASQIPRLVTPSNRSAPAGTPCRP